MAERYTPCVPTRRRTPPDEPIMRPGVWPALEFFISPSRPIRALFFFTKKYLPQHWLESETFPKQVDAVVHYGMLSKRQCDLMRAHTDAVGVPLRFVGDLDPLDLTVFATLVDGGGPVGSRAARPMPVAYAGIEDSWLRLCEARLGGRDLRMVYIRQDATERKLLRRLERSGINLEALVGPRSAALLREGFKVEVEGVSNPAIYGKAFLSQLLRRHLKPLPSQPRGFAESRADSGFGRARTGSARG